MTVALTGRMPLRSALRYRSAALNGRKSASAIGTASTAPKPVDDAGLSIRVCSIRITPHASSRAATLPRGATQDTVRHWLQRKRLRPDGRLLLYRAPPAIVQKLRRPSWPH